jgi:hypothetical protein
VSVDVSAMLLSTPESVRSCETPRESGPGLIPSGTNSCESAVEVAAVSCSNVVAIMLELGSSTSFSGLIKVCRLLVALENPARVVSAVLGLARRLLLAFVNAAKEPELLEGIAALREASAVLADTEAVGGPDTNIDRKGGSNEAGGEGS